MSSEFIPLLFKDGNLNDKEAFQKALPLNYVHTTPTFSSTGKRLSIASESDENENENYLPHHTTLIPSSAYIHQNIKYFFLSYSFLPNSSSRRIWNAIIFCFVLYNAISIPIRCGFQDLWSDRLTYLILSCIDYVGDILFWIDIFVQFKTAHYDFGILVTDPKHNAVSYLKKWFVIDLISTLPYDLFYWKIFWIHSILRAPRVLRLLHGEPYFHSWEKHSSFPILLNLIKMLAIVLLINHWFTCLYYTIAYEEGFGSSRWLPSKRIESESFPTQYLHGFSWSLKVISGDGEDEAPETNLETGISLFFTLCAIFLVAAVIGSFAEGIANVNSSQRKFRQKMVKVNAFMRTNSLPMELRNRIRSYYELLNSRKSGLDENSILNSLPANLRTEVSMNLHSDILLKVPFFQNCSKGFLKALVSYLTPQIYSPNDIFFKVGDIGDEMYFIRRGEVHVYSPKGKVIARLGEGGFFGEIACVIRSRRTATVKAKTYVDVSVLSRENLENVLEIFEHEKHQIILVAEKRVAVDSLRKIMNKEPFLGVWKEVSKKKGIIKSLLAKFKSRVVNDGEMVWEKGNSSNKLVFLGKGNLKIGEGKRSRKVENGIFLGLMEFVERSKWKENVVSEGTSILFELKTEDMETVMVKYDVKWDDLEEVVKKKMEEEDGELWKEELQSKVIGDIESKSWQKGEEKKEKVVGKLEKLLEKDWKGMDVNELVEINLLVGQLQVKGLELIAEMCEDGNKAY